MSGICSFIHLEMAKIVMWMRWGWNANDYPCAKSGDDHSPAWDGNDHSHTWWWRSLSYIRLLSSLPLMIYQMMMISPHMRWWWSHSFMWYSLLLIKWLCSLPYHLGKKYIYTFIDMLIYDQGGEVQTKFINTVCGHCLHLPLPWFDAALTPTRNGLGWCFSTP